MVLYAADLCPWRRFAEFAMAFLLLQTAQLSATHEIETKFRFQKVESRDI